MSSQNNIASFVFSRTKNFSNKPCFIVKDSSGFRRPISFHEFNDQVLKLSSILRQKFPQPHFKIGLWGENRIEWAAMALATWHAGGILVPLMHIATEQEIQTIVNRALLDGLFISPKLWPSLGTRLADFNVPSIYSLDFITTRDRNLKFESLGDLLQQKKTTFLPKFEDTKTLADDIAVLIFTSGTTGNPKGVMLSHGNILTNILDTIDVVPNGEHDRFVSVLPLSHMFELVGGFTVCHTKGGCISFPDSLKPDDVISELKAQKATALASVPLFFEILDRTINDKLKALSPTMQLILGLFKPLVRKYPWIGKIIFNKVHAVFGGSMKFFMSGGAKIDPDIILRFKSLGIDMFQGYGLTETSPVISISSKNRDKYGSVGKVVDSLKIKLSDEVNGEGEICVQGPSVFKGYFEDPFSTAAAFSDGWFHTGDVGHFDEERYLFLTGRKKDMIVTPNGKNIYPEEVEYYLKTSPHFSDVTVLGMNTGRGESVHAVIVTTLPEAEVWAEIERLSANLSDYKKVHSLTLTTRELPKTATKKVRKHLLREMITNGEMGQGAVSAHDFIGTPLDVSNRDEAWLLQRLKLILKREEIFKEQSLKHDLGLDSLTFMELISTVETHFVIRVEDSEFEKILKVSDLLDLKKRGRGSVNLELEKPVAKIQSFDFHLNNSKSMNFMRPIFNFIFLKIIFKMFFRLSATFDESIWKKRSFILTPNHSSHLDLLTLFAVLPLKLCNSTYAVAADDYFFDHPLKSFVVRLLFNAVPFKRKARVEDSFKVCEEILAEGGNLVIFPEGTRSSDGRIHEFKPGVGRLLAGKNSVAIPTYIKGAYDAFPKGASFPSAKPIEVHFALPLGFIDQTEDKNSYSRIAKLIHQDVESLAHKYLNI